MPKTAIDKNHFAAPGEDQIRPAGKRPSRGDSMEAVAVPGAVQQAADHKFGLGVLAPDPGHIVAALFAADGVGHPPIVGCRHPMSQGALSVLMIDHR